MSADLLSARPGVSNVPRRRQHVGSDGADMKLAEHSESVLSTIRSSSSRTNHALPSALVGQLFENINQWRVGVGVVTSIVASHGNLTQQHSQSMQCLSSTQRRYGTAIVAKHGAPS